jgi:subtilisin family serine protease
VQWPPITSISGPSKYYWSNSPTSYYRIDYQWYLKNNGTTSKLYTLPSDTLAGTDVGGTYDIGFSKQLDCAPIGIIDMGINTEHPEFSNITFTGHNFINGGNPSNLSDESSDSHGTGIAGVLIAKGKRILGMTNLKKIIIAKVVFDPRGITDYQLNDAIIYCADNGCKVVCLSWSITTNSPSLLSALNYAESKGMIVVIAVPNSTQDIDVTPDYPSSWKLPNVVSVTSANREGTHYSPSALGKTTVTLGAPGRIICTTGNTIDYIYTGGTSLATPIVTGTIAAMIVKFPTLSYKQIIDKLIASCTPEATLSNTISGGRLNLANALLPINTLESVAIEYIPTSLD